ncbi:MAG TPA: hypothetical protein VGI10_05655 [Polyangiaceae bacterium]
MQSQTSDAASGVARGAARCAAARTDPASYATGGWQGFEFLTTLSGCLASWVASNDADDLATAIKYWNVLLDDYQTVGDAQGGDTVVTHDTGYAMRTFAPYSALAYDWLHDAPGVTETLRAHARERFAAWLDYYGTSGYLRDLAGANYEAGYAFAATLIAVAEGGEAGAVGDAHWATVRDVIWKQDIAPAFDAGGTLDGGDWPEGWQYGPLSVLEHALGARAMQDNGVTIPGAAAWANSLALRFAYDLTPVTQKVYTAGDTDNTAPNRDPDNGPLLAVMAGPASDQAKTWARKLNSDLGAVNDNPLFDALAAAVSGASAALPATSATNYLARGTGNWYVRGAWTAETAWSVFQCSRHLVPDHEHSDAGNWVLTRGADDLVVDPSPYGSLSTLTSNAPAIDTASLPAGYSPSQGYWGQTTALVWARQSGSGVAAGRCDYADQFRSDDVPSDVSHALRDFVMVPHDGGATVVLVDRAQTGAAGSALHLRVRTPGTLVLSGNRATSSVGSSSLAISTLWSTSGTPNVRSMPQDSECASSDHTCDVSRLPAGTEYRIDVPGPAALAIHVVDALPSSVSASPATQLSGPGYRGVLVGQGAASTAVISNDDARGLVAGPLSYSVPAGSGALHVVLDAPVDSNGKSDVTATLSGSDCKVTVTAHQGATGGFDGRPLIVQSSSSCALSDDGTQAPTDPSPASGSPAGGVGAGGSAGGSAAGDGGLSGAPSGAGSGVGTNASDASGMAASGANSRSSASPSAGALPGAAPGCALGAVPRNDAPIGWFVFSALGLWLLGRRRGVDTGAYFAWLKRPGGKGKASGDG